jgi:hypothetical protein
MERRYCCPFIGRRGRGKGAEAVAWELAGAPLMAAAGGSVEWRGGAVSGRGKAGRRRSGWRRLHLWRSGGGGGARAAGEAVKSGGCAGKRGGGGRRKKKPDVWAPHVSE